MTEPVLLDSISYLGAAGEGGIVISGSHGVWPPPAMPRPGRRASSRGCGAPTRWPGSTNEPGRGDGQAEATCSLRYRATPSGVASMASSPGFQLAGHTWPCCSANWRASRIRMASSTLRPMSRSFTSS